MVMMMVMMMMMMMMMRLMMMVMIATEAMLSLHAIPLLLLGCSRDRQPLTQPQHGSCRSQKKATRMTQRARSDSDTITHHKRKAQQQHTRACVQFGSARPLTGQRDG
jgi:hypothetical protein